ncbi:hypothetical protein [Halobacillus salinus]|nr:hypothetical protein [Halobacillus salinus]
MGEEEREELIAVLTLRSGWRKEAFESMSDEELRDYQERFNA